MKYKIVYQYMLVEDETGKSFILTSEDLREIALMYIKLVDDCKEEESGALYYSDYLYKDDNGHIIFNKQGKIVHLSSQFCDDLTYYDLDDPSHFVNQMFVNKTDLTVKELTEEGYFDDI